MRRDLLLVPITPIADGSAPEQISVEAFTTPLESRPDDFQGSQVLFVRVSLTSLIAVLIQSCWGASMKVRQSALLIALRKQAQTGTDFYTVPQGPVLTVAASLAPFPMTPTIRIFGHI